MACRFAEGLERRGESAGYCAGSESAEPLPPGIAQEIT